MLRHDLQLLYPDTPANGETCLSCGSSDGISPIWYR